MIHLSRSVPTVTGDGPQLNWRVAVPVVIAGVAATAGSVALASDWNDAVSAVLGNVGVALVLVAFLVAIERRLVRRVETVAESTAREAANVQTSELKARVDALEELDRNQQRERQRRREEADAAVAQVTDAVTHQTIGDLVRRGYQDHLFDDRLYRVRTSSGPTCHVLYSVVMVDPSGVAFLWLGFEPLTETAPVEINPGEWSEMPVNNGLTIMWRDDPAHEIAAELETCLVHANRPFNDFSLAYAVHQIAHDSQVMRAAREAPAGDPKRLEGRLQILINDEWAITSHGLEAINAPIAYKLASPPPSRGPVAATGWHPTPTLRIEGAAPTGQEWIEALDWVQRREGWTVELPARPGT